MARHGRAKRAAMRDMMESIGHELKVNEPKIVSKTRKKYGKARAGKQKVAILLSKARKRGARIPKK